MFCLKRVTRCKPRIGSRDVESKSQMCPDAAPDLPWACRLATDLHRDLLLTLVSRWYCRMWVPTWQGLDHNLATTKFRTITFCAVVSDPSDFIVGILNLSPSSLVSFCFVRISHLRKSCKNSTGDSWTTWLWTRWVHFSVVSNYKLCVVGSTGVEPQLRRIAEVEGQP